MPAEQRGSTYRTKTGWGIQYADEHGRRHRQSGFPSKTEARRWFEQVEKPRQLGLPSAKPSRTFREFVEEYLAAHQVGREASTIRTLRERLKRPVDQFGDLTLRELESRASQIADWRTTLPDGYAYATMQAFRQTLAAAVDWELMSRNPAKLAGRNPQPKRTEIEPFTLEEIDRLGVELGAVYGPLVVFAAETGLRPSEWIALEWRDVQRADGLILVERTFVRGAEKAYGKTARSRRKVPLSARALDALDRLPPRRIDMRLVFPAPGGGGGVKAGAGGHLDLHNWRSREWQPAVEASAVGHGTPYTLRHTFATWALAAGITIFELARYMGTSVAMIDRTYGHLAVGSEQAARTKLDALAAGRGG